MKYYSIIKRYQVLKQTMTHINLENILNVNKKMKKTYKLYYSIYMKYSEEANL